MPTPDLTQPKAVAVLRMLTVGLMLVTAGVAGGVSYSFLAASEEAAVRGRRTSHTHMSLLTCSVARPASQFVKELDLSVASLRNGLIAAIDDRVLTVQAMDSVFHLPPGGQAAYADFQVCRTANARAGAAACSASSGPQRASIGTASHHTCSSDRPLGLASSVCPPPRVL